MKKRESLEKLKSYVEQMGFKGYDPYDGLNSWTYINIENCQKPCSGKLLELLPKNYFSSEQ